MYITYIYIDIVIQIICKIEYRKGKSHSNQLYKLFTE